MIAAYIGVIIASFTLVWFLMWREKKLIELRDELERKQLESELRLIGMSDEEWLERTNRHMRKLGLRELTKDDLYK